jgi:hypothetical protein
MLSRLRMPVEDCIDTYPDLAQKIFGKARSKLARIGTLRFYKYESAPLIDAIKDIVQKKAVVGVTPRQSHFEFAKYHVPDDLCRTQVEP